ncbi:colicin E1 family microcin immunity protein [Pseudomonas [fluorescens] ATCC 17400]
MEKSYYYNKLFWGVVCFSISTYLWCFKSGVNGYLLYGYMLLFCVCALLFPFSIKLVENIALTYTSKEFWTTGFFMESPAKNGAYAFFYMLCYVFSIPLSVVYFAHFMLKKRYSKE